MESIINQKRPCERTPAETKSQSLPLFCFQEVNAEPTELRHQLCRFFLSSRITSDHGRCRRTQICKVNVNIITEKLDLSLWYRQFFRTLNMRLLLPSIRNKLQYLDTPAMVSKFICFSQPRFIRRIASVLFFKLKSGTNCRNHDNSLGEPDLADYFCGTWTKITIAKFLHLLQLRSLR